MFGASIGALQDDVLGEPGGDQAGAFNQQLSASEAARGRNMSEAHTDDAPPKRGKSVWCCRTHGYGYRTAR